MNENGRKRKNDSNKRGEYRKFDDFSSQMRDSLIQSCAERVIDHASSNGGRCRHGFVQEMVGELYRGAPLMGISRDDINNKVRILKGKCEEEEQREVSPAIPFHIIRNPSLLTNSDLSVSDGSSGQHPLNMLASQAVQMSENTNQAQLLTLPNRCSYERCGAPLDLVPELCTYCFGYVHQICQQFAVGQGSPSSTLLCSDCCAIYGTGFDISAYAEDVVVDEEEEEEEEEEVEEDKDDDNTEKEEAHKKGGCPTGSTLEHFWAQKLLLKQAVNYVCVEYAEHKKNRGGERVEYGIRNKLVKQAIEKFGIEGDFDVRKQTIFNRISSNRLQVWHPGTESPLLEVEVILTSFIYTAHRLCCPLDVGDVIHLMNALISGTSHEKQIIAWKKAHCCYNPDSPLVGHKWFWNFCKRNPELWSQKARKYTRNREDHCN